MVGEEAPTFGVLLSRYRAATGLTQEELAERAGLSARGIGDLERGVKTRPRAHTVRQLGEALRLSPDDRALFERAARATAATNPVNETLSEGSFLGSLPPHDLVGREEERERILSTLAAVQEGRGHVLLLGGDVGAGKTRLLQDIMVEAKSRGFLVLTGHCSLATQHSSYSPFLEALSELAGGVPAGIRAECERTWKRSQRIMSGRTVEDASIQSGAAGEQQLCGAIKDLVLLAARATPVTLLIDDLHWADAESLNLLLHLARGTGRAPVLLTGSFCDARLVEQHPRLAQTLVDLARERLAERVTVRRLSLEETTQLVAAAMGKKEASEEFASFVYHRTKGNPRLIEQLVRSLGGRLELRGEIGAGSMGRVFRALDRKTGSEVAAKLVLARSAIELDALLRWQQEGAVLAKLRHPHIVAVSDTFAEEHATCIIMELLQGRSLGENLRDGPLSLPRVKAMALQVADALSYAHSQEIVHRDIKPDNVMVLPDDQVKVTDFGIARILQPDTSLQTIATTGMRTGTPLYMAPEQIEGKQIDGRTDIYALGAMLYHMMAGRPPFEGSDALTVAVKHLQEEPAPPSQVDPTVPAEWESVILKAMAKDPALRFQRAEEIREAIAALPAQRADASAIARPAHHRSQSWFVRAGSGAAAALVAVAVVSWLFLTPHPGKARAHGMSGSPVAVWGVKIPDFQRAFSSQSIWSLSTPLHGVMYIDDYNSDAILRVSTSGKLLGAWGTKGTRPGEINGASVIATDSDGNLYVADEFNNRIDEFTPNGRFLTSFGRRGINPGEFFRPQTVAIDPHGIVYVGDTYNDRIQKLSPTGKPLLVWGSPGKLPGQVHGPGYIKLDAQGNIYVIEHVNNRIQKFSPDGKSLAVIGGPGKGPSQFTDSQGLSFDSKGNMYVIDNTLSRVQVFSPTGKLLTVWGKYGNRPGEFNHPWDIAIDAQDHVYVADTGNGRIQVLTTSGKSLAEWKITSLLRPLFLRPAFGAVDHHGNVYVSDPGRNAIEEISPQGDLVLHWGRLGSGPGQFHRPSGVALDAAGNVYVADTGNSRIQEFTPGGGFVAAWPVKIEGTHRSSSPTGLTIDSSGGIYVTDPANDVVQGYSPTHKLHIQWGWSNPSHPLYRLKDPTGIAVDRLGNVYVADTGNHRIVEFAALDIKGTTLPEGHANAMWGGDTGPDRLLRPVGVAVDAHGDIYVADAASSRVDVLTPGGKLLAQRGTPGTPSGQLRNPTDIALDAAGNLYVVDGGNARIEKFAPAD